MLGHHLQPIGLAYLTDSFVKQDVFKVYSSIPHLVFHRPDKLEFLQCLEVDGVFGIQLLIFLGLWVVSSSLLSVYH